MSNNTVNARTIAVHFRNNATPRIAQVGIASPITSETDAELIALLASLNFGVNRRRQFGLQILCALLPSKHFTAVTTFSLKPFVDSTIILSARPLAVVLKLGASSMHLGTQLTDRVTGATSSLRAQSSSDSKLTERVEAATANLFCRGTTSRSRAKRLLRDASVEVEALQTHSSATGSRLRSSDSQVFRFPSPVRKFCSSEAIRLRNAAKPGEATSPEGVGKMARA